MDNIIYLVAGTYPFVFYNQGVQQKSQTFGTFLRQQTFGFGIKVSKLKSFCAKIGFNFQFPKFIILLNLVPSP